MQGKVTTKSLYTQVIGEINKRLGYTSSSSLLNPVGGDAILAAVSDSATASNSIATGEIVAALQQMLEETLPPNIISGLEVTAFYPESSWVHVAAGTGSVGATLYTLESNTDIRIPLELGSSVYYIMLYRDGLFVDQIEDSKKLTIAKIIVPTGITPVGIIDEKDDTPTAYIVMMKNIRLYGANDKLEEDSINMLRANIGKVMADNIIGTITLSEHLMITNTQGTVILDSKSLNLIDPLAGVTMAKFNKDGTFYYDSRGIEVARFARDSARIGNILIKTDSIESENFASGFMGSGFQIKSNGNAEFQNILARGAIRTSVFEYDTISAVGGNLLVMDADILDADMTALDNSTLTIKGDTTFSVGDILRIKTGLDDEFFVVTARNSNTYTVERDKGEIYDSNDNPVWTKGAAVVNYGQASEGGIYMTASEDNAPYLSVITHAGAPWDTLTTHLRLGNLNGFLGYSTDLYGIGIGNSNAYLKYDPTNGLRIKGDITITGGNAAVTFTQENEPGGSGDSNVPKVGDIWYQPSTGYSYVYVEGSGSTYSWELMSGGNTGITDENGKLIVPATPLGAGLYLGSEYLGYYADGEWKVFIADNGTFEFNGDGSNYITWDGSDLTISGIVNIIGGSWSHPSDGTKIDGGHIYTDSITALSIASNTITADKMNVSQLSAIAADLGSITAGTIVGGTIKSANSGSRIEFNTTDFIAYNSGSGLGAEIFKIELSGGNVGDITIGDYEGNNGIKWDDSEGTLDVRGVLSATSITNDITIAEDIRFIGDIIASQNIAVSEGYKVLFDGIDGDTYWRYNPLTFYLEAYVKGEKRMEM